MMRNFHFTFYGDPIAQGRPRVTTVNGFARTYDPAKSRNFKQALRMAAQDRLNEVDGAPFDGPIFCRLHFFVRIPSSWSKKKHADAENGFIQPVCKPDVDNLAKSVLDALSGTIYADDKQIVELTITKKYSEAPAVHVIIGQMGNEEKEG